MEALEFRTLPAVVGMLEGFAVWAIAGMPADFKVVESAYQTWLGPNAPPRL